MLLGPYRPPKNDESKLTFQKAVELAQSIESAEKDTEELQPSATGQEDPDVHQESGL